MTNCSRLFPVMTSEWEQNNSCGFFSVPTVPSVPTYMGAHIGKSTPIGSYRKRRGTAGTGNKRGVRGAFCQMTHVLLSGTIGGRSFGITGGTLHIIAGRRGVGTYQHQHNSISRIFTEDLPMGSGTSRCRYPTHPPMESIGYQGWVKYLRLALRKRLAGQIFMRPGFDFEERGLS